jgi:hypothetical protein
MEHEDPICPRCSRVISPDHSVFSRGIRLLHLDCDRPCALSSEERELLYTYCWDHAVADCAMCARSYRRGELASDLTRCPGCDADLTDRLRAHLDGCTMLPTNVRERARETREMSKILVKHSRELRDAADVLMREIEAALDRIRSGKQ